MRTGWWKLTVNDVDEPNCELNETDLEHISTQIKEGYREGEILHEE